MAAPPVAVRHAASTMRLDFTVTEALTGRVFSDLGLTIAHTVDDLGRALAQHTGVAPSDQILLFGPPFATLDSRRPLVDANGKAVFLYSRRSFAGASSSSSSGSASSSPSGGGGADVRPVVLTPTEVHVPTTPPESTTLSADDTSSPLVRALTDYERQLLFHAQQGDALALGARARGDSVTACATEVRNQWRALGAALSNLDDHCHGISKMFASFQAHFAKQQASQMRLLNANEANLEALRAVPLHPALCVNSRSTLWDCVPVDRLRVWADRCQVSHASLARKTQQLAEGFADLRAAVEAEGISSGAAAGAAGGAGGGGGRGAATAATGGGPGAAAAASAAAASAAATSASGPGDLGAAPPDELSALEDCVAKTGVLVEAQDARAKSLRADYDAGCDRVRSTAAALPTSTSQSTDALDACRVLEQLHQRHQTAELPDMHDADKRLGECQRTMAAIKNRATAHLLERLKRVSALQSKIRTLGNRLALVKEYAGHLHSAVAELRHVACMPSAYKACIEEVVRRLEYGRMYVAELEAAAERLSRMRDEEVGYREKFLKRHGKHLPRDLIPGLNERPPHAEIRARPFDTTLPVIEVEPRERPAEGSSGRLPGKPGTPRVAGAAAGEGAAAAAAGSGGDSKQRSDSLATSEGSATADGASDGGKPSPRTGPLRRDKERSVSIASTTSISSRGSVTSGVMLLPAEPTGAAGAGGSGTASDASAIEARERELRYEIVALKAQLASAEAVNVALKAQRQIEVVAATASASFSNPNAPPGDGDARGGAPTSAGGAPPTDFEAATTAFGAGAAAGDRGGHTGGGGGGGAGDRDARGGHRRSALQDAAARKSELETLSATVASALSAATKACEMLAQGDPAGAAAAARSAGTRLSASASASSSGGPSFGTGSSAELPDDAGRVTLSPALENASAEALRAAMQVIANRVSRANMHDFDWQSPRVGTMALASMPPGAAGGAGGSGGGGAGEDGGAGWTKVVSGGRRRRSGQHRRSSSLGSGDGAASGSGSATSGAEGEGDGEAGDAPAATTATATTTPTAAPARGARPNVRGGAGKGARVRALEVRDPAPEAVVPAKDLSTNLSLRDTLAAVTRLVRRHRDVAAQASSLRAELAAIAAVPALKFTRFRVGDTALFLPSARRGTYLAFNEGCPHHYLEARCVEARRGPRGEWPDYVIGRITRVDERLASGEVGEGEGDSEGGDGGVASAKGNPYHLPAGTVFFELSVESLPDEYAADGGSHGPGGAHDAGGDA